MSVDLNDPVVLEIVSARVNLLFDKPFFGQLACRLDLVDASAWCKTAATDGRNFYYNREFIKNLSRGELLFLVGHEVLHCVYDHLGRRGGRDPKIWNMANDYIVNWTLKNEQVGDMPEKGLYDPKITDEMWSEEVYEMLKKNSTTIKMTLDEHLELGHDRAKDSGDDEFEVTVMGDSAPPILTEDDLRQIRNEIKTSLIQTAQTLAGDKIPKGVRRLIGDLIEPKMDWRSLLDAHVRSAVKADYTYSRLSRRTWSSNGAIFPAQDILDCVEVAIAIDASGSMGEEMLRDILSEVKGIMQTFPDFKLLLWTFDGMVHKETFKEFTPNNISEIDYYHIKGGGGTTFEANWNFMKNEGIEPHRFVMFTDGEPGSTWGDELYCDTLFVIHSNPKKIAPFGMTAHYEPKAPTKQ